MNNTNQSGFSTGKNNNGSNNMSKNDNKMTMYQRRIMQN